MGHGRIASGGVDAASTAGLETGATTDRRYNYAIMYAITQFRG